MLVAQPHHKHWNDDGNFESTQEASYAMPRYIISNHWTFRKTKLIFCLPCNSSGFWRKFQSQIVRHVAVTKIYQFAFILAEWIYYLDESQFYSFLNALLN